MNYLEELQKIQDSEINFTISCFFDGGFTYRIGDKMNGFLADGTMPTLESLLPYLVEDVLRLYPASKYTREFRERFKN